MRPQARPLHRFLAAAGITTAVLFSSLTGVAGASSERSTGDPDSPYCQVARRWAVFELEPFDDSDPVQFRQYWDTYVAFLNDGLRTAPRPIRDDWRVYAGYALDVFTPVLEKYDFDVERLLAEGTDEEKAIILEDPPARPARAWTNVLTYESFVCGAQLPPPADVSFSGQRPGAYCRLVAAEEEVAGAFFADGLTPPALKAYVEDRDARDVSQALVKAAPRVIRDDVQAQQRWTDQRQTPALARFGYDIRRLVLKGSPLDRAELQFSHWKIREQYARVDAYEEQVCGV